LLIYKRRFTISLLPDARHDAAESLRQISQ